jgi:hypothetical protein
LNLEKTGEAVMSNVLNEGRVLLAYMGEQEALSFLRRRCVFEGDPEEERRKLYGKFSAVASKLPRSSTKVRVRDFDPRTKEYLKKVPTDRILSEAVRGLGWSFKKVEIDGLICIQKHVNLSYVEMISRGCDFTKEEDLVDICFTDRFLNRASSVTKVGENEYKVSADGDDLMLLGARSTYDEAAKTRTVSVEVGWGVPAVLVVKVGEKYFLQNGCHRVYALKARGIPYVPCVLVEGETYANLGNPGQPGFFSESLTMSKTPPTFAGFFSDRLSATVKLRPRHTLITVSAQVMKTPSEDAFSNRATQSKTRGESGIEDVEAISEGWNVYSLSDGNTLKVRQLVRGVGRSKDKGKAVFTASQTSPIVSVIPRALGTPASRDYSNTELESSVAEAKVGFEAVTEPVNEYVTESGLRFNAKLRLTGVSRTSRFDRDGVPIYLIKTESQIELA